MSTVESNGSETIEVPKQPIQAFFPLRVGPADDGAFEIGIVLGGTVSAAAYTADVLDFLNEASLRSSYPPCSNVRAPFGRAGGTHAGANK